MRPNGVGLNSSKRAVLVSDAIRCACRLDVLADKPGNVSLGSPGHGMTASDFLRSGAVCAPLLAQVRRGVGSGVLDAMRASIAITNCNTNLGIVLLAAPLARAAMLPDAKVGLRHRLAFVLENLTLEDSTHVFAAIRLADPGGLGRAPEQDVAVEPTLALKDVMQLAAGRDRIAYQYVNNFEDVFEIGLPALRAYRERSGSLVCAVTGVYLKMLARHLDSHIVRKHGADKAREVRAAAQALESDFKACENPATLADELNAFDRKLKKEGVNPGTSADLTVATVLALLLQHL